MILKDLISTVYDLSTEQGHRLWKKHTTLESDHTIEFLVVQINDALNNARTSASTAVTSERIRRDLLNTKASVVTKESRDICDFLILDASIVEIGTGVASGQLSHAYDWIVKSISNVKGVAAVNEIWPGRVEQCAVLRKRYANAIVRSTLIEWFRYVFYVARRRATFTELCHQLLNTAHSLVQEALRQSEFSNAISCLLDLAAWTKQFDHDSAGDLKKLVQQMYRNHKIPARERAKLGVALCTDIGDAATSSTVIEHAREVLKEYRSSLEPQDKVQVLCVCSRDGLSTELWKEIVGAVMEHTEYVLSKGREKSLLRYGFERLYDVLNPVVSQLCRTGGANELSQLFIAWYGVTERPIESGLLFINCEADEVHWFTDNESYIIKRQTDGHASQARLTEALNKFLGTTLTVSGNDTFQLEPPSRMGVPNATFGDELLSAVKEFYCLDSPELIQAPLANAKALRLVRHVPVPIQAALLSAKGVTYPISVSLQTPEVDRKCQRVLLWYGGTLMDDRERDGIVPIFASAGIAVDLVPREERTKSRFLECYSDPKYDVIWVTAHGEYDHFKPHETYITLDEQAEIHLPLLEIESIELPRCGRRLLVLNICDGATAGALGGALGLGLANSLAGARQAVISHGWPVHQSISPIFAGLLATELAQQAKPYFEAFCNTLTSLNQPKDDLVQTLRDASRSLTTIAETLDGQNFDPQNIFYWGSSQFVE